MMCQRCQGLMVEEGLRDWGGGDGYVSSDLWRCILCGEVVDPVIRMNRRNAQMRFDGRRKQARYRTLGLFKSDRN
jgi:hypothetical protein